MKLFEKFLGRECCLEEALIGVTNNYGRSQESNNVEFQTLKVIQYISNIGYLDNCHIDLEQVQCSDYFESTFSVEASLAHLTRLAINCVLVVSVADQAKVQVNAYQFGNA